MAFLSEHRDSFDSQETPSSKKSKRPPNSAFRQQRLKAWQPILSPQSVLPLLIIVAAIFAPIGVGLIISANNVQNISIDYSSCGDIATSSFESIPSKYVSYHFKDSTKEKPQWKLEKSENDKEICHLQFTVPNDVKRPIYVYYKLTNFYQNHRKYVSSFDLDQLKGVAVEAEDLVSECKPLRERDGKAIYPCGLIANSIFNDSISLSLSGTNGASDYTLSNKHISWSTDRKRYKKTKYNASQIVPPPNWSKKFPNGYTEDNIPDISTWEELQVWMRTAGLPKFYKLAAKNEKDILKNGTYTTSIELNYPVEIFGGSKSYIITTNSIIGGRNMSLGVVYLIVAGIAILFGVIFLIKLAYSTTKENG